MKNREDGTEYLIVGFDTMKQNIVFKNLLNYQYYRESFEILANNFTWLDGSPCGEKI